MPVEINDKARRVHATGGRKAAMARVFVQEGSGLIMINKKVEFSSYFSTVVNGGDLYKKLVSYGLNGQFDINVTVDGGGPSGQLQAVVHAIARALSAWIKHYAVEKIAIVHRMRQDGLLTRNAARKESKKFGCVGARAKQQFSKR